MLTRFGFRFVLAAVLTFLGAAASVSNLLYLVDGMLWAVVAVSWVMGRLNLRGLRLAAACPDQIFEDSPFDLALTLEKTRGRTSHQITIAGPASSAFVQAVRKGAAETAVLPCLFPRRGRNRLAGLRLESPFPFGLFVHRRRVAPVAGLAFPRVFEIYGRRTSPAVREEQVSVPRRGVGDEFHGLREYGEDEDSRLICWKLTAKTGRPIVKEYAQQVGNRITITVDDTAGPSAEARLSEAASLSKFFIDSGADVRLLTPEATVDFGHGLLHLHLLLTTLALAGEGATVRDVDPAGGKKRLPAFPVRKKPPALAYATAFVAFASLVLIEEIDPLLLLAFAPVFLVGWLFDRAGRHPLPRLLLDLSAVAFLLFFFFIDLPATGALQADAHLVLFILLYLLLGPKTSRVLGQLFVAAFLAFSLTSGLAVSLWYFLFFMAYVLTAGAWLIRRHDPEPAPAKPPWRRGFAVGGAAIVLLSALAFTVLPRPYSPRMQRLLAATGLTRFSSSLRSFAGLTERVELGYLGALRKNSARVMRVALDGVTAENRPAFIRVRGTAFGVFDGKRWRKTRPEFSYLSGGRILRARHAQAWMRRERRVLYAPHYDPDRPVRPVDIVLSPLLNTDIVFSVGDISALETRFAGAYFDSTDTAYFPSIYSEGTRYRILSQGEGPSFHRSIQDYEALLREQYAKPPVPVERFRQMAEDLTRGAPDAEGKARALERHFQTAYSYSLGAAHGRQSLEAFLFESRAGNCEYFATAMVLLLRHLGIPARLVIGFLSTDWNAYGRFFDVRQSDAHAWVEAFLPERGWTVFDPTPAEAGLRGRQNVFARIWTSARKYVDALQYRWYRYVVGYDSDIQRNLFFQLRLELGKSFRTVLAVLVLAAAAALLVWKGKLGRLRLLRRRRRLPSSGDFFEAILDRLARAGFRRRPAETAAEFAAALVRDRPELKPVARLAAYHYEIRYAGRRLSPDEEEDIRVLSARLGEGLRAARKNPPSALASGGQPR